MRAPLTRSPPRSRLGCEGAEAVVDSSTIRNLMYASQIETSMQTRCLTDSWSFYRIGRLLARIPEPMGYETRKQFRFT
jgi:hypothetical protein